MSRTKLLHNYALSYHSWPMSLFFLFSCAEHSLANKSLLANLIDRSGLLSLQVPFDSWTFDSGLSLRICAM